MLKKAALGALVGVGLAMVLLAVFSAVAVAGALWGVGGIAAFFVVLCAACGAAIATTTE